MQEKKLKVSGLIIWLISTIFYLYEFILQVSPGVLLKPLMQEFSLSASSASQIGAVYFFTYSLMQIPAGIFLDRFGPRKVLSVAAVLCTIGTFVMALAPSFAFLLLARFLIALGSATAMVGSMKVASNWFDKKTFATYSGFILLIGMLGAIFAKTPLAYSVEHAGWQNTLLYLGYIGIVVSLLNISILRDSPEKAAYRSNTREHNFRFRDVKLLLLSHKTWLAAIYGGLMFAPVVAMGTLWGEKFLIDSYAYSNIASATAVSFIFIGMGVGGPLGGWLSNILGKLQVMLLSTLCVFVSLSIYLYFPLNGYIYHCILGFLLGGGTALSWTVFAFTKDLHPKQLHATALAFVNFITMLIGGVGQYLVGISLDALSGQAGTQTQAIYTAIHYKLAFSTFPIFVGIAFFISIVLYTRQKPKG